MKGTTGIFSLILRGIALAMGVAVLVLSALGTMVPTTAVTLLAIGLVAIALDALQKKESI